MADQVRGNGLVVRGAVLCAVVQGGPVVVADLVRVHSEAQEELQADQRAVRARKVQQGHLVEVGPRFDLLGTIFLEGLLQRVLLSLFSQLPPFKLVLRSVGMAGSNRGRTKVSVVGQRPGWPGKRK